MKISWRRFFRQVALTCVAGVATAWSSAVCYALSAADNASDPVYADGWQGAVRNVNPPTGPGDNGGFGFKPWVFDNDTIFHVEGVHDINADSPFNNIKPAWRLGLNFLDQGKDIVRAGRGLNTPLQIGQTLSVVVDPPQEQRFYGGYNIILSTGGGNICYGDSACWSETAPEGRFNLGVFNFTDFENEGRWAATSIGETPLFHQDIPPGVHPQFPQGAAGTDQGMRMDFTLTGAETFSLTMTPLDNPSKAFTSTGSLDNPGTGTIDWIELRHYMTESEPTLPTDFYIRSLEISGAMAGPDADFDNDNDVDGADFLTWQRNAGKATGGTLATGDADGDTDVDGDDFTVFRRQFAETAVSQAVPEPGTIASFLAAAGSLGAGSLVRRRGTRGVRQG